jgi:hypothetical protein
LCTPVAVESAKTAGFGVSSFVPKWRATADKDGHYSFAVPYDAARQATPQLASGTNTTAAPCDLLRAPIVILASPRAPSSSNVSSKNEAADRP